MNSVLSTVGVGVSAKAPASVRGLRRFTSSSSKLRKFLLEGGGDFGGGGGEEVAEKKSAVRDFGGSRVLDGKSM
jgi:hypothetical protein